MAQYFHDLDFDRITYDIDGVNFKEFEGCRFTRCNFSACSFLAVTFIDCVFDDCVFSKAKINYVAFRTVAFDNCEMIDINFAMCDKLIFDVRFTNCILDFSKFYTLKLKTTTFTDCSLIAVDFMSADLTGVRFERCDLYRALFMDTIANKADFRTGRHYVLDPKKNKIKKAVFSLQDLKGLVAVHEIEVI